MIDHNHSAMEALAREVLDAYAAWGKTAAGSDECTRATEAFTDAVNRGGINLARAVIELTAERDAYREENTRHREQRARVEALADRLENEAAYEASRGDTWDATCIRAEARRIRTALNGDDR